MNAERTMLAISLVAQWKNEVKSYEEIRKEITAEEALEALKMITGIKARAKELAESTPLLFNPRNFKRSQV
jgi:hypothetical protein